MYDDASIDELIAEYCAAQRPTSTPKPFFSKECISPLRWREADSKAREKREFTWTTEELAHLQSCAICKRIQYQLAEDINIVELPKTLSTSKRRRQRVAILLLAASILIAGTIFAWLFTGQVKPDQNNLPSDLALQANWVATGKVLGAYDDVRQYQPSFNAPPGTWYMAAIELIDNEVLIRPSTNEGCEPLVSTGGELVFPETFVRPTKGDKTVYLFLSRKPLASVLTQLVAEGSLKLSNTNPANLAEIVSRRLIGSDIELAGVGQLTLSSSGK